MPRLLAAIALFGLAACRSTASTPAASPAPVEPPRQALAPAPVAESPTAVVPGAGRVAMEVTAEGFEPARIPAKKGQPITLAITRKTDETCAREIVFQGQGGKTPLPLNKTVEVTYTPKASGEIKFGCGMGMMVSGVLAVGE